MATIFLIDGIIRDERIRNLRMQDEYQKRIDELPKGSLSVRLLNNNKYCYFRYRSNGKVISQYAGSESKAPELQELICKRKHFEKMLKLLKEEEKKIALMEKIK